MGEHLHESAPIGDRRAIMALQSGPQPVGKNHDSLEANILPRCVCRRVMSRANFFHMVSGTKETEHLEVVNHETKCFYIVQCSHRMMIHFIFSLAA
jgi:hypothetical protein